MQPGKLEEILIEALEEGQNCCLTPELREGVLLEAYSEAQREISKRIQNIMASFCNVLEELALQRSDEVIELIE